MSFRQFVYYGAVCGAGGGLLGWAVGRLTAGALGLSSSPLDGFLLGLFIAVASTLVEMEAQLSLRQRTLALQRLLAALLLGGVGGLLGGLCIHLLRLTPTLGLLLGWAVMSLVIGAASGVFDWILSAATGQDTRTSQRKILLGMLGGLVGGLIGALAALALRAVGSGLFSDKQSEQLWTPAAWGSALVGAFILLASGVLQVRTRQAWLQIEQGAFSGAEILLTRPLLTLGRGDRCDIGLTGDQKVEVIHARLEQHGRRYLLLDGGSAIGTMVNNERLTGPHILTSGDRLQIGDTILTYLERRAEPRGATT